MNTTQTMVEKLVENARKAQQLVADYSQEKIDEVCLSVGWQLFKDENVFQCAESAVKETGMGVYEDKIKKHKVKVGGVCRDILNAKTVGVIEKDEINGITKYAKPVGVVGALTPVTNPTATCGSNGVGILKGRNAVIFAPHPRAKKSCKLACDFMRDGLLKVGAPIDLVQCISEPSIEISQELMRQVDLVVATGGAPMVRVAYSSGTPAYGVGVGNPVVIIAEDADLKDAAEKIAISKTFDNATSCSSENALLIHESIFVSMISELEKQGAHVCNSSEKAKLQNWMWKQTAGKRAALNPEIIAVSAKKIAEGAGIDVPEETRFLLVEGDGVGDNELSGEKISPVLTFWTYRDFEQALDFVGRIHSYAGLGHSCGLYTFNQEYIQQAALKLKVSRILVRQAHAPSAGGNLWNGMPSTVSLGCGTWGGTITTENIHWKQFINVTWLAEPIVPSDTNDEMIFGKIWDRYGK